MSSCFPSVFPLINRANRWEEGRAVRVHRDVTVYLFVLLFWSLSKDWWEWVDFDWWCARMSCLLERKNNDTGSLHWSGDKAARERYRIKDSMERLTGHNASAEKRETSQPPNSSAVRECVRAREVNNQAWIIDETSIHTKIAFFLFSFCFSFFFPSAQTLRQWRAAHVQQVSIILLLSPPSLHSLTTVH